jgi:hypothetical protein
MTRLLLLCLFVCFVGAFNDDDSAVLYAMTFSEESRSFDALVAQVSVDRVEHMYTSIEQRAWLCVLPLKKQAEPRAQTDAQVDNNNNNNNKHNDVNNDSFPLSNGVFDVSIWADDMRDRLANELMSLMTTYLDTSKGACSYSDSGGYWRLELCWQSARQYHADQEGEVSIDLGSSVYAASSLRDGDDDVDSKNDEKRFFVGQMRRRKLGPAGRTSRSAAPTARDDLTRLYLAQRFVGGDVCDLTGKPRVAEVRYSCAGHFSGGGDVDDTATVKRRPPAIVQRIDEPSSCSYVIYADASEALCRHALFAPLVDERRRHREAKAQGVDADAEADATSNAIVCYREAPAVYDDVDDEFAHADTVVIDASHADMPVVVPTLASAMQIQDLVQSGLISVGAGASVVMNPDGSMMISSSVKKEPTATRVGDGTDGAVKREAMARAATEAKKKVQANNDADAATPPRRDVDDNSPPSIETLKKIKNSSPEERKRAWALNRFAAEQQEQQRRAHAQRDLEEREMHKQRLEALRKQSEKRKEQLARQQAEESGGEEQQKKTAN